jgi:hypothetical protein
MVAPARKLNPALDATDDLEDIISGLANCLRMLLKWSRQGPLFDLTQGEHPMDKVAQLPSQKESSPTRMDVFVVENYEDDAGKEKSNWTRVGAAFPHKDAKGFTVELRAIPVTGKLVMRLHEESPQN